MKVGAGIFECAPIEASRSVGLINLSNLVTVVKTLHGHLVQISAVCLHSLIWKCSGCIAACAYKLHIHYLCTMCTCVQCVPVYAFFPELLKFLQISPIARELVKQNLLELVHSTHWQGRQVTFTQWRTGPQHILAKNTKLG